MLLLFCYVGPKHSVPYDEHAGVVAVAWRAMVHTVGHWGIDDVLKAERQSSNQLVVCRIHIQCQKLVIEQRVHIFNAKNWSQLQGCVRSLTGGSVSVTARRCTRQPVRDLTQPYSRVVVFSRVVNRMSTQPLMQRPVVPIITKVQEQTQPANEWAVFGVNGE